jgi:hypothetical protein
MNARVLWLVLSAVCGCGARTPLAVEDDASSFDAAIDDGFAPADTFVALPDTEDIIVLTDGGMVPEASPECPGTTACTDGVDNDGDGLIDSLDPECTSPLDRDESSFSLGIPGDNIDPCKVDCWFDGNSGSGDDGCQFQGKCLPGMTYPKCPFDPAAAADPKQCLPQSDKCRAFCEPRTPNGCDCAGCCDVFDKLGRSRRVRIVGMCTTEKLDDPASCPPCDKVPDCGRPCGRCDYCLGKVTIPSDCTDAMKTACPAGAARCGPTNPCPCGEYCLTGCCVPTFG